ncbi:MAG: GNAT family N-acetyltransferase [Longimicrobiales bacterium]
MSPQIVSFTRGEYAVSTDPARLDIDAIHDFLHNVYWAQGRSRETVERSLRNSLGFGLYHSTRQIGLARIISDYTTYAYLCDVYVLDQYRGQGLGTWLIDCVMKHPDLQGLTRFSLVTRSAQALYRKFGFAEVTDPHRYMNLRRPDPG